jgi:hypothetical protein
MLVWNEAVCAAICAALFFFWTRRRDKLIAKGAITKANSGLKGPKLAQLRPLVVGWSTLCRPGWVRKSAGLLHYDPVSPGSCPRPCGSWIINDGLGMSMRGRFAVDQPTIIG